MASDDSVVVAALSVEEAIIVGLTRLTATRDEVDIEILDEAKGGFLGIGSREARVRLTRRPEREVAAPMPRVPATEAVPVVKAPAPSKVETEETAVAVPQSVEVPKVVAPVADVAVPVVTSSAPAAARSERRRSSRSASAGDDANLDRAKIETVARDIMEHLLPGLSLELDIEWVDEDRPTLWVSITGRDADSLVGPRARNLHSLQYLFRALIYQQADGNYNVVVDADGYRRRRRRSLESLAQKKADQAVEQGQPIRLRAMPAHERRIIHMLLKEDDRVSTESSGKGRDRAITIVPNTSAKQNRS